MTNENIHCPFCLGDAYCRDDGDVRFGCKVFYIDADHKRGCFLEEADEITTFYDTREEAIAPWTNKGTHRLVSNTLLADILWAIDVSGMPTVRNNWDRVEDIHRTLYNMVHPER